MYSGVVVIAFRGWGTGVQFKSLRSACALWRGPATPLQNLTTPKRLKSQMLMS